MTETPTPDPEDLAPDHDDPGDDELSPEIADLASDEDPGEDETDERPDSDIEVESEDDTS